MIVQKKMELLEALKRLKKTNEESVRELGNEESELYKTGTTDHIFSLQTLVNKHTSAKKGRLYTAFIYIKGAFDNVCMFLLWKVCRR